MDDKLQELKDKKQKILVDQKNLAYLKYVFSLATIALIIGVYFAWSNEKVSLGAFLSVIVIICFYSTYELWKEDLFTNKERICKLDHEISIEEKRQEWLATLTPEEREENQKLEMQFAERQMKARGQLSNQLMYGMQGGLSSRYKNSTVNEMDEMTKKEERWKTLFSLEERRRELGVSQPVDSLNTRIEFNLPRTCPKCNKEANWKLVDSETKETLDSAYTLMGSTTIFTKEKITRRFICEKCGFEIKR